MAQPPVQQLATHLLNQTLSSISLLESLSVINSSDAHLIRSKLPSPTGPFPSLNANAHAHVQDTSNSFVNPGPSGSFPQGSPSYYQSPSGPPSVPPRTRGDIRAKALWDYHGAEADDLTFRSGDTLIIDEEVNEQWYRGRVIPQGQNYPLDRSGLFPSNYIEKLTSGQPQPQSPPYYAQQPPNAQMVPYQPPGPPQPYQNFNDNKYAPPPPPQHMQMVPQQQQLQQQQQPGPVYVQQPDEQKKSKFGKLGGTLGNAAVHGAGFGFGSAVASEMVHKIF